MLLFFTLAQKSVHDAERIKRHPVLVRHYLRQSYIWSLRLFLAFCLEGYPPQHTNPHEKDSQAAKEAKGTTPELTYRYQIFHIILHSMSLRIMLRNTSDLHTYLAQRANLEVAEIGRGRGMHCACRPCQCGVTQLVPSLTGKLHLVVQRQATVKHLMWPGAVVLTRTP